MLTQSNAQAVAVFAALKLLIDEDDFNRLIIHPYINGREDGFAIQNFENGQKVAFSENRKSDDIVVYSGNSCDFSLQGNTPTAEVYKDRIYFPFLDVKRAALYIKGYLIDGISIDAWVDQESQKVLQNGG